MSFLYDPKSLYEALKQLDIIPEKNLDEVLEKSKKNPEMFSEVLLGKDYISDENLGKVIAEILSVPFVKLSSLSIDPSCFFILPSDYAHRHKIVLFEEKKNSVGLAFTQVLNSKVISSIENKTGKKVILHYATLRDIEFSLRLYEKNFQQTFDNIFKKKSKESSENHEEDVSVIEGLNKLIEYAYNLKASDIHIEPEKENFIVRVRIDGNLREILRFPHERHQQFISRIKYLAQLRTDEHLSAQDGKFQIVLPEEALDIRVSIVPITHGEKCVMRLLALHYKQFGLSDLGIFDEDLQKIKKAAQKPYGMILTTGPTGSGKTTAMYAILKILNSSDKNIATIEDPVEYDIEGVNQIQVNPKTNLTFAQGLRSILRQDPNIIFVGEIRDNETADIAVNSALTGHLVLSTLHTNDAATTLPRLLDMNIEPYLVASTINIIVAQRLIRKICEQCRVSYMHKAADLKNLIPAEILKKFSGTKKELRFYKGKGCDVCDHTGYSGRIGIFEILELTSKIQEMVMARQDSAMIKNEAVKEGMATLLENGLKKILEGQTSIDEVLLATRE